MKRYLAVLVSLLAVCSSFAASKVYESNVGQFIGLNVSDDVKVIYHCNPDSTGMVRFECDPSMAESLIIRVSGGTLKISVPAEFMDYKGERPVVHAYSDYLTSVNSSSLEDVEVISPSPCPEFKATLIGNGTIRVSGLRSTRVSASLKTGNGLIVLDGECDNARLQMVGTGTIQADRLAAKVVTCKIMGSGSIGCAPEDTLKVRGIGSTKIYYSGNPVVDKKGGGKLIRLENSEDPSEEPEEDPAADDAGETEEGE